VREGGRYHVLSVVTGALLLRSVNFISLLACVEHETRKQSELEMRNKKINK
jgi:hypothetical protein